MIQFVDQFQAAGIEVVVAPLLQDSYLTAAYSDRKPALSRLASSYLTRLKHLLSLRRFDVVWLEKELFPMLPAIFERVISAARIPYVVDYDDATFHTYDLSKNWVIQRLLGHKVDTVMRRAALVTAGNAYLATRAADAGARSVLVVPSVVDLNHYGNCTPQFDDGPFRIGWIG
jgi:hypothetical protein